MSTREREQIQPLQSRSNQLVEENVRMDLSTQLKRKQGQQKSTSFRKRPQHALDIIKNNQAMVVYNHAQFQGSGVGQTLVARKEEEDPLDSPQLGTNLTQD